MAEKKTVELPVWAKLVEQLEGQPPTVIVQAELMYESYLSAYDVGGELSDRKAIDQYWLEVCYQSMKLDLQLAMGTYGFSIYVEDAKKKYAQKDWPPGRGPFAATRGKEAREHFKRLRGRLPASM